MLLPHHLEPCLPPCPLHYERLHPLIVSQRKQFFLKLSFMGLFCHSNEKSNQFKDQNMKTLTHYHKTPSSQSLLSINFHWTIGLFLKCWTQDSDFIFYYYYSSTVANNSNHWRFHTWYF